VKFTRSAAAIGAVVVGRMLAALPALWPLTTGWSANWKLRLRTRGDVRMNLSRTTPNEL